MVAYMQVELLVSSQQVLLILTMGLLLVMRVYAAHVTTVVVSWQESMRA